MLDDIKILDDLPSNMDGAVVTPASSHLFDMDESAEMLSDELGNTFHHNTAKQAPFSVQASQTWYPDDSRFPFLHESRHGRGRL
jgi:hypothetical protein